MVKQSRVFGVTLLKLQVPEFWRETGVRNDGKARHPCYRSVLRRSTPWRRSRPERCSGEIGNQLVMIRHVAQCFWREGLHVFSRISPSCVKNVWCAPHPSHLNTLLGMEETSVAREERESARSASFRQACVESGREADTSCPPRGRDTSGHGCVGCSESDPRASSP